MALPEPLKNANSARPKSLNSPVPGNDAFAAAAQAYSQKIDVPATQPTNDAFTAAAQAHIAQSDSAAPPQDQAQAAPANFEGQAVDHANQVLSQGALSPLDAVGRAFNLVGGVTRAGLAEVGGMAQQVADGKNPLNEKQVVSPEDVKNAFKGKGPGWAEYLKRMGISEGYSVDVAGEKFTSRGAGGLALDIATDPLVAVGKLAKEVPYIGKFLNAGGNASEILGEATYKSAYPNAEIGKEFIDKAGAPIIATEKQVAQKILDQSQLMGKLRKGLYDQADQLGAKVPVADMEFSRAQAVVDKMSRNNNLAPLADEAKQMIENFRSHGEVPLSQASEWKTDLYSQLPKSMFVGTSTKLSGPGKQFKAAVALDLKDAIVDAGNAAQKGLGDGVEAINSRWGTLLDSVPNASKQVAKPAASKLGHMIDGAVLAAGFLTHGPEGAAKALALKKAYELATSPAAKTAIGKALMAAGRSGLAQGLTNQAVVRGTDAMPAVQQDPPPEEPQP